MSTRIHYPLHQGQFSGPIGSTLDTGLSIAQKSLDIELVLRNELARIRRLFRRNGWGTRVLHLIHDRKITDFLGRKWISILVKNTKRANEIKVLIQDYEN